MSDGADLEKLKDHILSGIDDEWCVYADGDFSYRTPVYQKAKEVFDGLDASVNPKLILYTRLGTGVCFEYKTDQKGDASPESQSMMYIKYDVQLWISERGHSIDYMVTDNPRHTNGWSGGFGTSRPPETSIEKAIILLLHQFHVSMK